MKLRLQTLALTMLLPLVVGVGCSRLQAKQAFKDGNKSYKEENYKRAIERYTDAIGHDPDMAEAYFYMGSSYQALYRPGKDTPENKETLQKAIDAFVTSIEKNPGSSETQKSVKNGALAALTGIYSEEPYRNYDKAYQYAEQLVQQNPSDSRNIYAMANLFKKFDKVDEAEKMFLRAVEVNPQDERACNALAGFYNEPHWDGRSKFDMAIEVLQRCATLLKPDDPTGYYKVGVFYWDKAYRDPTLQESEKDAYADKGLEMVEKALQIKPDYVDALVYKGLLLRVKAQVAPPGKVRDMYTTQAQTLAGQARELRAKQTLEAEEAAKVAKAQGK
jgi:tetratricopeptide (TPR) repeat protein